MAREPLLSGRPRLAALAILSFDAYLPPSEALQFRSEDMLRPARGVGPHYHDLSLVVCSTGCGRLTKTGERDGSFVIGVGDRKWVAQIADRLWRRSTLGQVLFPFSLMSAKLQCPTLPLDLVSRNFAFRLIRSDTVDLAPTSIGTIRV